MRRFKFEKTTGVDTPGGTVVYQAGEAVAEDAILAGCAECGLARGWLTEVKPDPAEEFERAMSDAPADAPIIAPAAKGKPKK